MKTIINKCINSMIKIGASASSSACALAIHEPKRPEKLK